MNVPSRSGRGEIWRAAEGRVYVYILCINGVLQHHRGRTDGCGPRGIECAYRPST